MKFKVYKVFHLFLSRADFLYSILKKIFNSFLINLSKINVLNIKIAEISSMIIPYFYSYFNTNSYLCVNTKNDHDWSARATNKSFYNKCLSSYPHGVKLTTVDNLNLDLIIIKN